jgi:flagellar protein FliS
MFATLAARPARFASGQAYRQIGVETGVAGASPHRLVQMLFDGFVDSVAQARGAMRDGRIEAKGHAIVRAVRIVDEGLRAGLDLKDGGPLAEDLRALYDYITMRLTYANLHNDDAALAECTRLMEPLRSAWQAIDPNQPGSAQ